MSSPTDAELPTPDSIADPEEAPPVSDWIYHQKLFSLPPAEQAIPLPTGDRKLLKLPIGLLRDTGTPLSIATDQPLCLGRTITKISEDTTSEEFEAQPSSQWSPALLLRCPLKRITSSGEPSSLFELEGLTIADRWHLEQLNLLRPGNAPATLSPANLQLWIEPLQNKLLGASPIPLKAWTLSRSNLAGFSSDFPYLADQEDPDSALRLLQMVSLTRSHGYFIGLHDDDLPSFEAEDYILTVALRIPTEKFAADHEAARIPPSANAVIASAKLLDGPIFARLEGAEHVVLDAYRPGAGEPIEGAHARRFFYTDALVPPAGWPGFSFTLAPVSGGKVTLHIGLQLTGSEDQIRQLRHIHTQVRGFAGDVAFSVENRGLSSEAAFTFASEPTTDLTVILERFLSTALSSATPAANLLTESIDLSLTCGTAGKPAHFHPVFVIHRTEKAIHPPESDPTVSADVYQIFRARIISTESPITLASVSAISSFDETARAFADVLGSHFKCQIGTRRDRFGDPELWWIPDSAFPKAREGQPTFASPRPLNNALGGGRFSIPDFVGGAEAGTKTWGRFNYPLRELDFSSIDPDALAGSVFKAVEEMTRSAEFTAVLKADSLKTILAKKALIALTLGRSNNGYVVPVSTLEESRPEAEGIARLSQAAFLSDLRLFNTIDTLVQWPIAFEGAVDGISRYYGNSIPAFDGPPPFPEYSGFVIDPAVDTRQLTVSYQRPAGQEPRQRKTTAFAAVITHVELATPRETAPSYADRGTALELVPPTSDTGVSRLAYADVAGYPVPTADRSFPLPPVLSSARSEPAPDSLVEPRNLEDLVHWRWELEFRNEAALNDIAHLEVDYAPRPITNIRTATAGDWRPRNLIHALLVLGQLVSVPSEWWATADGQKAQQALADLLGYLYDELQTPADATAASSTHDDLTIALDRPASAVANPDNPWVKDFEIIQGEDRRHLIVRPRGFPLSLTTSPLATSVLPRLKLRRNEDLAGRSTNPLLVYESAAVSPSTIAAFNHWTDPIAVAPPSGSDLAGAIRHALDRLFGAGADLREFFLHIECSHSSLLDEAGIRTTTPVALYVSAENPTGNAELAGLLADHYVEWFQAHHPLGFANPPAGAQLWLGLQVAERSGNRPILHIEALTFDLATIRLPNS